VAEPITQDLIKGVKITITPIKTKTEEPITVFEVEIIDSRSSPGGSWHETFGTSHDLCLFLKGLRIGGIMIGGFQVSFLAVPSGN
jgi:hypothetical protein